MKLRSSYLSCICAAILHSAAAFASPNLSISQDMPLRFGTFIVFGNGSRTVSANGAVTNTQVYPVGNSSTGPAQFTVTYDRGSDDMREISVNYVILLSSTARYLQGGLSSTIANFETDIPGAQQIMPGHPIIQSMPACRSRICRASFHIGAQINVTGVKGGAPFAVPLPVTVTLMSVQSL